MQKIKTLKPLQEYTHTHTHTGNSIEKNETQDK